MELSSKNVENILKDCLLTDFPLPRDVWSVLPGGMPYLVIKDKQNDQA